MSIRFKLIVVPTVAVLVAALLQIGGCASTATSPTSVSARVAAETNANQDSSGRSLPIVVRLYELKSAGSFQSADFYSLYNQDREVLGDDLLARDELNLQPGDWHEIKRPTDPAANFLGVIGAFREIDVANWRAIHHLKPNEENSVVVKVTSDAIFFSEQ
jgi:type VI secretion system protein VasD